MGKTKDLSGSDLDQIHTTKMLDWFITQFTYKIMRDMHAALSDTSQTPKVGLPQFDFNSVPLIYWS